MHVGDGADDARLVTARIDDVSDGVAVGIEMPRGAFIQDDDGIALRHIAFFVADERPVFPGEVAAGDRDAHRSEIAWRDHVDERALAVDMRIVDTEQVWDTPTPIA